MLFLTFSSPPQEKTTETVQIKSCRIFDYRQLMGGGQQGKNVLESTLATRLDAPLGEFFQREVVKLPIRVNIW